MQKEMLELNGESVAYYRYNTIIVGSGAAGLNAASRLYDFGQHNIAIVTEGMNMGTSRNTGSDKQTYYRLSEAGDQADSVAEMAHSIYAGGAADLDVAYCEAAGSLRAFYRLVELGISFPQDRSGVFVGYRTDHDPKARATSVGPSTSRLMTEALEREVRLRGIDVFDGYTAARICKDQSGEVIGLLAIERASGRCVAFGCKSIVYATGGPAGLYSRSVYPGSQTGATGVALEAGADAQNLTEWQYGLASVKFRWNVSGSYQQVIPRYISTDADGNDEREFLNEYFASKTALYNAIFLKGYQWPFDPRKAANYSSSLIDLLVYNETELRGRRVFLDFSRNPEDAMDWSALPAEPLEYLKKLDLLFGTPIERLAKMNQPAIDLYLAHDIDITREPLEIQMAAQHCNGGLSGDIWWQSNLPGLFTVGEANGSHGVYRPGGSALNAGQVGSMRAAQYIAARRAGEGPESGRFQREAGADIEGFLQMIRAMGQGTIPIRQIRKEIGERMSRAGAFIRHPAAIEKALAEAREQLGRFATDVRCEFNGIAAALQCRDLLITQICVLSAMRDYDARGGGSRGSYLVYDPKGTLPLPNLDERFRFSLDDGRMNGEIQTLQYADGGCRIQWRPVRELPDEPEAFEKVWADFREGKQFS